MPGYVALEPGEPEAIAAFLGLDVYAFTERYTTLTFNRRNLSLIEQEDGRCVFLQDDNDCRIQPVKPAQCRGFPFLWHSPRLEKACPALRTPHHLHSRSTSHVSNAGRSFHAVATLTFLAPGSSSVMPSSVTRMPSDSITQRSCVQAR